MLPLADSARTLTRLNHAMESSHPEKTHPVDNPALNDRRWLIGKSLVRLHLRTSAPPTSTPLEAAFATEIAGVAAQRLAKAKAAAGPDWPILERIVIANAPLGACRDLAPHKREASLYNIAALCVALDRVALVLGFASPRL